MVRGMVQDRTFMDAQIFSATVSSTHHQPELRIAPGSFAGAGRQAQMHHPSRKPRSCAGEPRLLPGVHCSSHIYRGLACGTTITTCPLYTYAGADGQRCASALWACPRPWVRHGIFFAGLDSCTEEPLAVDIVPESKAEAEL